MQQELISFLTEVLDASVPHAIAEEGQQQLRIAHEYESMGDRLASVLKGYLKLRDQQLVLPDGQREELLDLHDAVTDFLRRRQRGLRRPQHHIRCRRGVCQYRYQKAYQGPARRASPPDDVRAG
jgi:Na+/phosphate symporter